MMGHASTALLRGSSRLKSATPLLKKMLSHRRWEPLDSKKTIFHGPPQTETPDGKIRMSVLENGLKVVSKYTPDLGVSLGVITGTGGRFETLEDNGVAHFMEHLIFKSTKDVNTHEVGDIMEEYAIRSSAFTQKDHTCYMFATAKDDVGVAVPIMARLIQDSAFTASDVNVEKGVIQQEISSTEEIPREMALDAGFESAWGGHAAGRTILGPRSKVMAMTPERLKRWKSTHFVGEKMVLVGCGDIPHDELVGLAEVEFGGIKAAAPEELKVEHVPLKWNGTKICALNDIPVAQSTVALYVETLPLAHPASPALRILQRALGEFDIMDPGKPASTPFTSDLARMGVHMCESFHFLLEDCGAFAPVFSVPSEVANTAVLGAAKKHLERLTGPEFTEEEFKLAVSGAVANLRLDSPPQTMIQAELIGLNTLRLGRPVSNQETEERIKVVNRKTFQRLVSAILERGNVAVGVGGPIGDLDTVQREKITLENMCIPAPAPAVSTASQ